MHLVFRKDVIVIGLFISLFLLSARIGWADDCYESAYNWTRLYSNGPRAPCPGGSANYCCEWVCEAPGTGIRNSFWYCMDHLFCTLPAYSQCGP